MQIGEAIAVLVDTSGPQRCPFCDSMASPTFAKKEMVNDAAVLARNAGGMPAKTTPNPESTEDYYIYDRYWLSDDESAIVMSPHHLLPGNASIARCPEILKWMSGSTSIKKQEHSKTVMLTLKKVLAKVRGVPSAQRAKKLKQAFDQAFPSIPLKESADGIVSFALDGDKVDSHSRPVSKNYVTGEIDFDVNDEENCIWLPSHCAISTWSDMIGEDAWHCDQRANAKPIPFEVAYAYNTMRHTKVQFHDAHPTYSSEVIRELKKLNVALQKLADTCLFHPGTTSTKKGPYRAPLTLTPALHKLAELCARQLKVTTKKKPRAPWYTSDLALEVRKLI